MTDDILSEIEARQRKRADKSDPPTRLYQSISIMKEFQMSPSEWNSLSRTDKKILHYHRIMECHYLDKLEEKRTQEMKREEEKQKFLSKLPRQMKRGR